MKYLIVFTLFIFTISFYVIYKSWEKQKIKSLVHFFGTRLDKDTTDKFLECIEIINKNKEFVK